MIWGGTFLSKTAALFVWDKFLMITSKSKCISELFIHLGNLVWVATLYIAVEDFQTPQNWSNIKKFTSRKVVCNVPEVLFSEVQYAEDQETLEVKRASNLCSDLRFRLLLFYINVIVFLSIITDVFEKGVKILHKNKGLQAGNSMFIMSFAWYQNKIRKESSLAIWGSKNK